MKTVSPPSSKTRASRSIRFAASLVCVAAITGSALGAVSEAPISRSGLAKALVSAFDNLFGGPHAGYRAVHARGVLLDGTFTPSAEAASLTRAVHVSGGAVPVLARFSNFAGVPDIADNDGDAASPRGMSIKFLLPGGGSTDIVAHSFNGFPASTPEDFLAFLQAAGSGDKEGFAAFVAGHPAAKRFVEAPKPSPESYATETFYGVNAFLFSNADGVERYGKYVIVPEEGARHLSSDEAAARDPNYLHADLEQRLPATPFRFRLMVQLQGEGDSTIDGAFPWPADRPMVELGVVEISAIASDNEARQRDMLFTPLSLVGGIAPSEDPMLSARTRAYRVSYNRRAQGGAVAASQ